MGHQSTVAPALDRPASARRFEWIGPALVAVGVFAGLWVFLPFLGALALTAALGIGALAVRRVSKRLSTPPFPTIAPEERLSAPPVPRVSVPPAPRVGIPSSAPRVSIPSSAPRVSFPSSAPRVSVSSAAPRINIPSAAPRVGPERDLAELEVRADGGPRPGDVLGQYQLLACVGEGGMGRVWAARNISSVLQRIVAVKTATRRAEQKTELRHLFMDEARIALLVRHPNVCGVNEFGEHEGVLYQVMEWCDGASLRQVLDRLPGGSMDIPVAVRIMAKVSAGLHAAHELLDDDGVPMHVVHRDVSPQNILISTTGQVKVTDFGVAKANGQLHRPLGSSEVKGKVSYIAPEQVMGGEVDRRADIFALGSILYEATTGHCPFSSEGSPSTLYQLISQPIVPPSHYVPGYPPELAQIVLTALGKDPAERHATAEQFGVALESWLVKMSVVVTERTIAEMMTAAVGTFTREKQKRIEQSLALSAPPSSVSATLTIPDLALAPGVEPARPTLPARPNAMARAQQVSVAVRPSVAARPTLPAGPAARKPSAPR